MAGCIGLVCNGEIEITTSLQEYLKNCASIIGVDGGLNHCKKMEITPQWAVGDFDSIDPTLLEEIKMKKNVVVLPRAKDCTDLEVAIDKAKEISAQAQVIIWGGLGGRIDHTLGNILLLFRDPARLFLQSEQQILFVVSNKIGEVEIRHPSHQTMTLLPLNGPVSSVSIKEGGQIIDIPVIDKSSPMIFTFKDQCTLTVGTGEVLVILEQKASPPLSALPQGEISMKFSLDQPLATVFEYLTHQSFHFQGVRLSSAKERISNIQHASGKVSFPSKRGQTVSLVPFYGPAKGIKTQGLKWELGEATLDKLDKDFVGISNVSMGNEFSVAVESGELLCIVNEGLIDQELVEAKINK